MYKKIIKRRLREIFLPVLFFLGILALWEGFVFIFNIPQYLLPKPTNIFSEIVINFNSLLKHTGITMLEAVIGFLLGNILGFVAAVIFSHSETAEKGFYPYAIALKTTPILAMAPLLVLWFGTGMTSKIVASAIVCFFPILVNTVKGLKTISSEYLDLLKSFSARRYQIFIKLRLPNSLPYIFSALKISTGLAMVGAIVGEFVGAKEGIGFIILISTYHLETVRMFAAIIMSALGGVLFFYLINLIEKWVVFWQRPEDSF